MAFAVIGLNGGRPYTSNPCFAEQYRWAQRMTRNPAIYINLDFPKPGRMEALEALEGPYGRCAETDTWCRAYNWGYGLGADAAARARAAGVTPGTWWLDVEVGNYWSSEPEMNAQVVRGVVDYMREKRLPIGIYGTPYQWRLIAGSAYNPRIQIWTAGAQGPEQAVQRCTDKYAFGGGHVQMVQYETHGFDSNYICPGTDLHLSHMLSSYTSGAQGIRGELLGLGYELGRETVRRYMHQARRRPPSQTWRTCLRNHAPDISALRLVHRADTDLQDALRLLFIEHRQRKLMHPRRIGPGLPPVGRSTGHPFLGHRYKQEHIACATGLLVPRALPGRGCPRRELPRRLAAGRVGPTPAKVRTPGPGSGIRLTCYPADRGQRGPWQHPPGTVVEEEMRL